MSDTQVPSENEIPKIIYICHKNKSNIANWGMWKTLNPEYDIQLFDNKDCTDFLQKSFGKLYVDVFNRIKDGPIKADFWRVCIVYTYGGVYADADIHPMVPIADFLDPGVDFLTCNNYLKDSLNPHLIIAKAGNPILKRCIDQYIEYYIRKEWYEYWHWSITHFMFNAFKKELNITIRDEGIYAGHYQIISEIWPHGKGIERVYCAYKGVPVLMNRAAPGVPKDVPGITGTTVLQHVKRHTLSKNIMTSILSRR